MTPAGEVNSLEYAPAAPIRRRKRVRRIATVCVLLALSLAAWRWGPGGWRTARVLYHQRTCMRYTASPEQVVFDTDPTRVAQLAADPNFVVAGGCAYRKPPDDWAAIYTSRMTPRPSAAIFLHALQRGGMTRLVEVERVVGKNQSPYFIIDYDVEAHVLTPATIKQPRATEVLNGSELDVLDSVGPKNDIRIFAGQIDPADPSHFTVRFESRGKTKMADGYLQPDSTLRMAVRPQP